MASISSSNGVVFEENVPVPVRDGTILRANVFRPAAAGRYPAIVERTPYGKAGALSTAPRFAQAGYAYVSQDIRGRFASDGDWMPFSAPATQDADDGYDTIEWTAAQPWCDGKVGSSGLSYGAWAAWMLARRRPPHLRAMAARSIPAELTDIDWPGAFRLGRRVSWWIQTMAPDVRRRSGLAPQSDEEAGRDWAAITRDSWAGLLPVARVVDLLPPGLAGHVADWLAHPSRQPWRFAEAHAEIAVPNLDTSGWFDHCNGTISHLGGLQRHGRTPEVRAGSRLIIGPWNHMALGRRRQGDVDFGKAAHVDIEALLIRWFDHWLKGAANGVDREPPVRYFVLGSNEWKTAASWPPPESAPREFFLRSPGSLSPEAPTGDEPAETYAYDPRDPVPSLWSTDLFIVPSDRRRLEHRRDILRYTTAPLAADIEIAGHPEVILHAASSAPDTDFFARLVDDAPAGAALEIACGMVRARHRHSLGSEDFLTPGVAAEFRIRLGPAACRFRRGHRIRLEITSSDFPSYDRNHNTGGRDLFDAELRVAHQQVFHTASRPSRLILPLTRG